MQPWSPLAPCSADSGSFYYVDYYNDVPYLLESHYYYGAFALCDLLPGAAALDGRRARRHHHNYYYYYYDRKGSLPRGRPAHWRPPSEALCGWHTNGSEALRRAGL